MPRNNWADNTTPITAANLNAMVVMDTTEAATNDSVSTASDFISNANRIRYQLAQIFGGAWNAAVQMIPLSQKNVASGVPALNAQAVLRGDTGAGTPTISNVPAGSTVALLTGSNNFR